MSKVSHSERGLATLKAIGCDVQGWRMPDIEWRKEKITVRGKKTCPTCKGRGQVGDYPRTNPCPTCPRKRTWYAHGTGEVVAMIERTVLVGYIVWPKGTKFKSRWAFTDQCNLCGKPVRRVCPVLNTDSEGNPVGMWVGEDCNRKILGIESGVSMEMAEGEAAKMKDAARVWREIPKPTRVVKPKPPALDDPAPKGDLDAVVRELFSETRSGVPTSSYDLTRSTLSYHFYFPSHRSGGGFTSIEVKVTARHGVVLREYFGEGKPIYKNKDSRDAVAAIRAAAPKIREAVASGTR